MASDAIDARSGTLTPQKHSAADFKHSRQSTTSPTDATGNSTTRSHLTIESSTAGHFGRAYVTRCPIMNADRGRGEMDTPKTILAERRRLGNVYNCQCGNFHA